MSTDLNVNFLGIRMKTPIIAASGTFGFGVEYKDYMDLSQIGAISCKGIAITPWDGNEGVRIAETSSGILNCIGLENPGTNVFKKRYLPELKKYDVPVICNIVGRNIEEYGMAAKALSVEGVDAFEVNISCPNVKSGGMNFGTKTEVAREIVRKIREICRHKLVVKLSPNAEDIVSLAQMCEEEGADGVSLTNTFLAMAIDLQKKKPVFNNTYAGLSGPAIKPIALRMVHQVSHAVNIPVMGLGGITTWQDAIEFIMAGATVIQVGTATFMKPDISMDIIDGMEKYLEDNGYESIEEIRGII